MTVFFLFLQSLVGTLSMIAASYLLMYGRSEFKALASKMREDYAALDTLDSRVIITEAQRVQREQIIKRLELSSVKLTRMRWTSWIGGYVVSTVALRLFNKLFLKKNEAIGGYLPFYFPVAMPPFNRFLQAGLPKEHDPNAISTQIIVMLLNQALRPALLKIARCELPSQILPRKATRRIFGKAFAEQTEEVVIYT